MSNAEALLSDRLRTVVNVIELKEDMVAWIDLISSMAGIFGLLISARAMALLPLDVVPIQLLPAFCLIEVKYLMQGMDEA